jgi:hypothetical protein
MARTGTERTDVRELKNFSITDPAENAAVTTAIVDQYSSVIITTTGAANAQTLQDPTNVTNIKRFTVMNNDTSTDPVTVNGTALAAGNARYFIWDGDAWVEDAGGGSAPVDSVFGRTGAVVAATNDYTWAQVNKTTSDIADIATKSHTSLTDIGSNAHSVIDTHLGAANPHSGSAASGANTDITSLRSTSLSAGRDADNFIDWSTDNQLDIRINASTTSIASISTGAGDNDKLVTQGYVDDNAGGGASTTFVEASRGVGMTSGGRSAATVEASSIESFTPIMSFTNGANDAASFGFYIPDDKTGISSIKISTMKTTTGNIFFDLLSVRQYADGSDKGLDQVTNEVVSTGGTVGTDRREDLTVPSTVYDGLTFAAGDYVVLAISRDGTNASDTYEAAVEAFGLLVTFS